MQLGNKKMTKAIDETQVYLFCEYSNNDQLWNKLKLSFEDAFNFLSLSPQSAIFVLNNLNDKFTLISHF